MKTASLTLGSAGVAAGVSLVLGAAGLTIALIAAASPPVSEYMTAAQNASEAERVGWTWITPAMVLVMGTWAMAQVVLRRPILTSESTARRWPVTNSTLGVVTFVVGVCVVLTLWSTITSMVVLRDASGGSITDSVSFAGLGLVVGGAGLPLAMLSGLLLLRWWQRASV
jgi:hypothetical protein